MPSNLKPLRWKVDKSLSGVVRRTYAETPFGLYEIFWNDHMATYELYSFGGHQSFIPSIAKGKIAARDDLISRIKDCLK